MQHARSLSAVALWIALTASTAGAGAAEPRTDGVNLQGMVREFNVICGELQGIRFDLQERSLDEAAFGDSILALFVQVDSIRTVLQQRFPISQPGNPAYAMGWALRHLTESLRENYEGIVEKNGYRFVTADIALEAAEAWKGSLGDEPGTLP
jgi:hypothetical protein